MAYTGQILENTTSGETITFVRTSADTGGEALEILLELTADGKVPGAHVHPEQEERFEVLEGTMVFRLGLKRIVAGPGDVVVVPKGRVHAFCNWGDGPVKARVTVTPALDMEHLFETVHSLAADGRVMASGMPKPLDLALFVRRFEREVRAPFPPAPVVRALLAPLAALAERRGHATRYAGLDVHAPQPLPA